MRNIDETFVSMNDFRRWLDFVSGTCKTQFYLHVTDNECSVLVYRYCCNRSGVYNPKVDRARQSKSQDSCKIGRTCTASYLRARECLATRTVKVPGCLSHYYHDTEVEHLRLNKTQKHAIALGIEEGIPTKRILSNMQGAFPGCAEDMSRLHLITRKDIGNVAQSSGLLP